ncbi:hypothetical protein GGF32_003823 [Allomyces javanicus]|nr:hypothetical protein GGF32_003823 [Allomyces javanicus]
MAPRILVTGFFDRGNFGDELFAQVYRVFLADRAVVCTTDNLKDLSPEEYSAIIVGGGDVLNRYFTESVRAFVHKSKYAGPVYCFSSRIPYHSYVTRGNVNGLYTHISVRSVTDYDFLKNAFSQDLCASISYAPDASLVLAKSGRVRPVNTVLKVGMCVARPVCQGNARYLDVCRDLARIVTDLVTQRDAMVEMVPFNTNTASVKECDVIMQNDILGLVPDHVRARTTARTVPAADMDEMAAVFGTFDVVLAMRFHAHIVAIASRVPPFSRPEYCQLDESVLVGFNVDAVTAAVGKVLDTAHRAQFDRLCTEYIALAQSGVFESVVAAAVAAAVDKTRVRPETYVELKPSVLTTVHETCAEVLRYLGDETPTDQEIRKCLCTPGYLGAQFPDRSDRASFVAALILHRVIAQPFAKYHYGLAAKVFSGTFVFRDDVLWVMDDYLAVPHTNVPEGPPLDLVRTPAVRVVSVADDMRGKHRAGWPYVMDHVTARFHDSDCPVLFDGYIDKTFLWGSELNEYLGVIPYERPWCGIVHHTFHSEKSPNHHLAQVFANPWFRKSLPYCRGLIALSEYLADQIRDHLKGAVPVFSTKHPTDLRADPFSLAKFAQNAQRGIINIGAWLRNPVTLYLLQVPPADGGGRCRIRKMSLQGRDMSGYFPSARTRAKIAGVRGDSVFDECLGSAVEGALASVDVISSLSNADYDALLTRNIVFLDLVDVSACNVVLECIVRGTPLLVNRHPAVVEYLGPEYPFYYTSLYEASTKCNDLALIKATHEYLMARPKTDISVNAFLDSLHRIFKTL